MSQTPSSQLYNKLSGIISSQIDLATILNTNYYTSKIIDDKLSGLTEITDNLEEYSQTIQILTEKLQAVTGTLSAVLSDAEISGYYKELSTLEQSFEF